VCWGRELRGDEFERGFLGRVMCGMVDWACRISNLLSDTRGALSK